MNNFLLTFALGFSLIACTHRNKENEINSSNIGQMQDKKARQEQRNMPRMQHMQNMMMSPEMHENMATMHQQIADCLKSDRDKQECMQIMRSHHQEMCEKMGKENCRMMGGMMNQDSVPTSDEEHERHH